MNKTVSVVIPVYNDRENLQPCLKALCDNKDRDFEIIIVDDGSNDHPQSIAKKFSCKVLTLDKNIGPAYARNRGVEQANGSIILFTDADCVVMKDWARIISEELIRAHKQSTDVIAVSGRLVSPRGLFEICHTYSGYAYTQGNKRRFMDYLNTAGVAVYKKAFLEVNGFKEEMRVSEDPDLALRLREKGYKIIFEPSIFAVHNHGIDTFRKLLIKHRDWGKELGRKQAFKFKNRPPVFLKIFLHPFGCFILIVPLAFLTTLKIVVYNINADWKILIYSFFIFISKIFYRWGIFIKSLRLKGAPK